MTALRGYIRMRDRVRAYKSEAMAAAHETAQDLYEIGLIDARTMREFDEACLTPVMEMTPPRSLKHGPGPA